MLLICPAIALAQREVKFPPAESKPPPPAKSPPRTQASGEDTGILPDFGPTMRKTQERQPPPPTTLTVMYKVQYGETLKYVFPDGTVQNFAQWESFKDDGYKLVNQYVNQRLADGNNYQYAVKPLSSPEFDPVDIPILYMTGDYEFLLTDAEVQNLRRFLLDGGTILFNAARGRDDFSFAVVREMRKVFPQKTFMKLPLDHAVYNTRYRLQQVLVMVNGVQFLQDPELYSIDIGTRAAAILIPGGMGTAWSEGTYHPAGKHIIGESAIRLGVNLVSYVLGSTEYGRFLAQTFPEYEGASRPGDVFRFAALRYAGSWDVNPALQNSLMQGLFDNTGIDVDFAPHAVSLEDPTLGSHPLLWMTGHYDFEFSPTELEQLRDYLRRGGILVASAAAGLKPFDTAFRREIRKALPDSSLIRLPPTHPLFAAGWNPLHEVEYTPAARRDDPTLEYPEFFGVFIDNRLAVLYSPYDFQSGLNRESNAYAKGLTSDDALRIALNLATYALSH
ncbi:MAG: hypothetical protein A2498_00430 [Lentisphaerae bacterium RIFOXYC12_FULL_60_16]|nr:MAG: hypothetical protein A2498_00430 [Lentisphaerae bacterium RIFOXYC12_FULL_60_16]OGV85360.1 MAG: hypothetical protein A2340_05815 [Lentisphaerae bacterium RIFOXYB12_FULL_60_10]